MSHDRLQPHGDGRLRLALKTPWHDGTTHLILTADELLERLVALVPRSEKNLLVYHGVLAPNAKWRSRICRSSSSNASDLVSPLPSTSSTPPRRTSRTNADWARLMRRAFDIDVLDCDRCGARMRLLALVQAPQAVSKTLRHLGLRDHAPPIAPARHMALDFDDVA